LYKHVTCVFQHTLSSTASIDNKPPKSMSTSQKGRQLHNLHKQIK